MHGHKRLYDQNSLANQLEKAGFKQIIITQKQKSQIKEMVAIEKNNDSRKELFIETTK